mgnify:CR=1 FL=1
MLIKKSNSIIRNISKFILLASILCVGANANEIKNQEIIKVFYQNATSNSLLVKKEINEANETFKNVSSVLNNKKNAIARLVEINKVKNPETRKFMLNIYLNQLAEIEKKYDKSLIDYPNSKNLFLTDYHDFEIEMIESISFTDIVNENSNDECHANYLVNLKDNIYSIALIIGYLR